LPNFVLDQQQLHVAFVDIMKMLDSS